MNSYLRHWLLSFLVVTVGVNSYAQDDSNISFNFQSPLASKDSVRVYYGTNLKIYRTQQFRLKNTEYSDASGTLTLFIDTSLTEEDKKELDKQLVQHSPDFTVDKAVSMSPVKVEVSVIDVNDNAKTKSVGNGTVEQSWPGNLLIIKMPYDKSQAILRSSSVKITPVYKVRSVQQNFVRIDSFHSIVDRIGETVLGGKQGETPKAGDYITRNAKTKLSRYITAMVTVKSVDATPSQKSKIETYMDSFVNSLDSKEIKEDALNAIDTLTIWTPGLGRIEIHPSTKDYKRTKEEIASQYSSKIQQLWSIESEKAKKAGNFEEWYKSKHDQYKGSGSFSGSADVMDVFSGSSDMSFSVDITMDSTLSGKRSSYEDAYSKFKSKTQLTADEANSFYSKMEGNLNSYDTSAKQINLSVWRDTSIVKSKAVELLEINNTSATPFDKPFDVTISIDRFVPEPIESMVDKIAKLQESLNEFRTFVGKPIKIGSVRVNLYGPGVSGDPLSGDGGLNVHLAATPSVTKLNDGGASYSGKNILSFFYYPVRHAGALSKCDGYFGPGRDGGGFHWHPGGGGAPSDLQVSVQLIVFYTD